MDRLGVVRSGEPAPIGAGYPGGFRSPGRIQTGSSGETNSRPTARVRDGQTLTENPDKAFSETGFATVFLVKRLPNGTEENC